MGRYAWDSVGEVADEQAFRASCPRRKPDLHSCVNFRSLAGQGLGHVTGLAGHASAQVNSNVFTVFYYIVGVRYIHWDLRVKDVRRKNKHDLLDSNGNVDPEFASYTFVKPQRHQQGSLKTPKGNGS